MKRLKSILNKKYAFTLAEVLIVIGIIGMIADMTIPTLVTNVQEKTTVVTLKKAYSTLSQAYTLATTDNGTPDTWGLTADTAGTVNMIEALKPYLNMTKDCGISAGCFPDVHYKHLSGTDRGNINTEADMAKAQLVDGSLLAGAAFSPDCSLQWGASQALKTVCGDYWIDVNGYKNPNIAGKDIFIFHLTKSGLVPAGTQDDSAYSFPNACYGNAYGWGCTAWVIYNENMDYTKCSTLSWSGPSKCN